MEPTENRTFDVAAPVKDESLMQVEVVSGPKPLSDKDLREYAKAAGIAMVKVKTIRKRNIAGDLIQRLGAARHGSWMLFESEEMILEALRQIDKSIDDYPHLPEVVTSLIKIKASLIERWQKAAVAHIKSKKDVAEIPSEKPLVQPPPMGGPPQQNVQVNVMVQEPPKE